MGGEREGERAEESRARESSRPGELSVELRRWEQDNFRYNKEALGRVADELGKNYNLS